MYKQILESNKIKYILLILAGILFVGYFFLVMKYGVGNKTVLPWAKLPIEICLLFYGIVGYQKNKSLRNKLMILILFSYAVGSIICSFSIVLGGGVVYFFGHFVMIYSLYSTTLIKKTNIVVFTFLIFALILASGLIILNYYDELMKNALFNERHNLIGIIIVVLLVYIVFLSAKVALAITNTMYLVGSIIFAVSDIAGFFRIAVNNSNVTYFFTLLIYYIAIILYANTTYIYNRKPDVKWEDMIILARKFLKNNVKFCFTKGWGKDIVKKRKLCAHKEIFIAADRGEKENIEKLLYSIHYKKEEELQNVSLCIYYSEAFGSLCVSYQNFKDNNTVIIAGKEREIKWYKTFFLKKGLPVLVPEYKK